jgi:hypothetical protein
LTIFHFQDNQLTGSVPASLADLTQLEAINLENNHLTGFPDISENIPPLQELLLARNNFVFGDLEPYIDAGLTTLTYGDQDSVHAGMDTTITEGDDLVLTALVGGSANVYQWKKDGVNLAGSQNGTYSISSATLSDAGVYHCEITSSVVPDLILYRREIHVTVEEATRIVEPSPDIPGAYNLHQNYPNPFNPVTVIRYDLPDAGRVEISVHNIVGQKLATLIAQKQPAGYHQVQFDGSDMSSGVYFYKITTEKFTQVKKMILLR